MTGLETSVQLLGGNKLWFNRKTAKKTVQMPNYPCTFQKSNKYSGVHLSKCDYCSSKLFTQTDRPLIWQHMLKCRVSNRFK